jgi:DNA-binding transcriptional MerR regulator
MTSETYDISKLVQESGIPRRTIYFYVQQGVLPPPVGAGLAAFYTEEHLLRLRMIPMLRGQGLRLDEIRRRLAEMSEETMRQALITPAPAAQPGRQGPVEERQPATLPQGRALVQYNLPGGVMLLAPNDLKPEDEHRLRLLLESAAAIYRLAGLAGPGNGKLKPDLQSNQPEEES